MSKCYCRRCLDRARVSNELAARARKQAAKDAERKALRQGKHDI